VKLVGVLKGSVFFLTALARHIEVPVKIDFLGISSFSNKSGAPGVVRIAKDLDDSIEGEDVLLVETLWIPASPCATCCKRWPARAQTRWAVCTFLDRNSRRIVQVRWTTTALRSPIASWWDSGLDYNQLYRNLSYVAVMKPEKSV